MTEYRWYVTTDCLVDSTINSMIVESFVVVITRIAKQYFTRLYCDRSKYLVIVGGMIGVTTTRE